MEIDKELAPPYLSAKASQMFMQIFPLQNEIRSYHREIDILLEAPASPDKKMTLHNLRDEIFCCRVEIHSLQKQANELVQRARYLRLAKIR